MILIPVVVIFGPFVVILLMNADWIYATFRGTSTAPAAYWKLDEGQGQITTDSSTTKRQVTLGSTSGSDANDPAWTDQCVSGKCLDFDGSDDYTTSGTSINISEGALSFWFMADSLPNNTSQDWIISQDASGDNLGDFKIGIDDSADSYKIAMEFNTGSGSYTIRSDSGIETAKWYHITATWGAAGMKMYVNGALQANTQASYTDGIVNTSATLTFGAERTTSQPSNVKLDEVRFYNYVLTTDQIKADYNGYASILGVKSQSGLSSGLVGYWKMDESSWTNDCSTESVLDSSGKDNNGESCPNAGGISTLSQGKFGNAPDFDGANDYVSIDDASSLRPNDGSWSVSVWAQPGNTDQSSALITKNEEDVPYEMWGLYICGDTDCNSSGQKLNFIYQQTAAGGFKKAISTVDVADGNWHQYTAVADKNSNKIRLYMDGTEIAVTENYSGIWPTIDNTHTLVIGSDNGNSYPFDGKIDEARIYNRALSAKEVLQLYSFVPGPVGYWNFEETSGTLATDKSGNGNNGTLFNSNYTTGKYGQGVNLTGQTNLSSVTINNSATLVPTYALTVAFWFKAPNWAIHDGNLLAKGGSYHFFTSNNNCRFGNALCFDLIIGGSEKKPSILYSELTNNKWHYLVGTYDGENVKLYADGILRDTVAATGSIGYNATHPLCFGESSNEDCSNSGNHTGIMDEVKIYNYARTPGQIIEDMNGGHPVGGSPIGSQIGFWKFDEGSANTCVGGSNDVCNSGSQGSALDGAFGASTAAPTITNNGKMKRALDFDGSDDVVTVTNTSAIDMDSGLASAHTFSTWVYADSDGEADTGLIYSKGTNTWLRVDSQDGSNNLDLEASLDLTTSDATVNVADAFNTSGWNHVAVVYEDDSDDEIQVYVNGKLVGTSTGGSGTPAITDTSDLLIGNNTGGTQTFDGRIDSFKIYNSALSTQTILLDYNAGKSLQFGVLGTDASGNPSNATDRAFCPPGDTTATCGPVAYWNMEEGTGTTIKDISGNNNTSSAFTGEVAWINGKYGKGLSFDGTNDVVRIVESSSTDLGGVGVSYSVSAWFKTTTNYSASADIVTKDDSGSTPIPFKLYMNTSEQICFLFGPSAFDNPCSTATFNDGKWHHAVGVRHVTDDQVYVYVDGVRVASTIDTSNATAVNNDDVSIGNGGSSYTGRDFNGSIDEVKIYNYARSASQIAWDYSNGKPIARWKFDECTGSTAYDSSGNNLHGTLNIGSSGTTSIGDCTTNASTMRYNGRTGKRNYGLSFDNSDDYVNVPYNSLFGIRDDITITAWIKRNGSNTYDPIIAKTDGSVWDFDFMICDSTICTGGSQDRLTLYSDDTAPGNAVSTATITDTNWHHVAVTRSGSTVTFYIDGINAGTDDLSGSFDNTSIPLRIGTDGPTYNAASVMNGYIDDVRIYNFALTSQQIRNAMNDGAIRWGPVTGAP